MTTGDLSDNFCFTLWRTCIYYLVIFWDHQTMFFSSNINALTKNQCILLGQLGAMALLYMGKGPHCLHPATVEYLLLGNVSSRFDINVDDSMFIWKIQL